jgi:hypothetical protein
MDDSGGLAPGPPGVRARRLGGTFAAADVRDVGGRVNAYVVARA